MGKAQFKFNKQTLQYERINQPWINKIYSKGSLLLIILGLVLYLTKLEGLFVLEDSKYSIILGLAIFSLIFGVGSSLFGYLQSGSLDENKNSQKSLEPLVSEIENIKIELLKLRKKSGGPDESEKISKTINNAIDKTLTDNYIKEKIDGIYSKEAIAESKNNSLLEDFESLSYRIDGELTRLRKSANLNLGSVI